MKKLNSRTHALAARITELEKRRANAALFPTVIEIVGVERGAVGALVEVRRYTLWEKGQEKSPF